MGQKVLELHRRPSERIERLNSSIDHKVYTVCLVKKVFGAWSFD